MNIQTATKDEILTEVLLNEEMYPGLDFDSISGLAEKELKEVVHNYIFENDEVYK